MNRTYLIYNHQHKGDEYANALQRQGYHYAAEASVILMDIDTPGRIIPHRKRLVKGNARLFTYPHSARVNLAWDGLFKSSPYTAATFVTASGHKDVMEAYGYKKPIHVTGWTFCKTVPFTPNKYPRKILFAPIHPNKNGFLASVDRGINKATFERLYKLHCRGEIDLSVRHVRSLVHNGLEKHNGITYIEGNTDLSFTDIDRHDLIVAHQTFAYLALARGKPVLMMAEDKPPRNGAGNEEVLKYVASWDKYKDQLMYPLDILTCDDTMKLIERASLSDLEVSDWKRRMIGEPFDGERFVNIVESYFQ